MNQVRRRWIIAIAALLMALCIGVGAAWKVLNQPAVGIIKSNQEQSAARSPENHKDTSSLVYAGKYFTFNYPNTYRKNSVAGDKNYLESIYFVGTGLQNKLLSASVRVGSVSTDPGARLRLNDKSYSAVSLQLGGYTGYTFTRTTPGFEKSAIVSKGNILASISLTSSGSHDLSGEFTDMLNSWSWR